MLYKKELDQIPRGDMPDKYPGSLCLGVAQVVELKRSGKILVVDFYQRADKSHLYRFCSDGRNYCTKSGEAGAVWTEQNPRVSIGYLSTANSKEDLRIAADFLNIHIFSDTDLLNVADSFISRHRWSQREKAYDRRENLRKEHFAMYPAYPANLESYCKTHLFTPYVFISVLDKKGRRQGRCSCCGAEFEAPKEARSGQPTSCPVCGKPAVYRGTWLKHLVEDKAHICIASDVDGQKLLRWVEVRRRFFYPDFVGEYAFDDYAYNLFLNTPGGVKTYFYKWMVCGYHYGQWDWYRGAIGDLCHDSAPVYIDNIREVFGERYCGVDLQKTIAQVGGRIPVADLLDNLEKIPATEYLLKLGMVNLAKYVKQIPGAQGCRRPSFTGVLGVDGQFAGMYREMDITFTEHTIIKNYGKFISREQMEMYRSLGVPGEDADIVSYLLAGMSFSRFVHYFTKQKRLNPDRDMSNILTCYRDYLDMSQALGVDLSHKGIRFPKNCVEAHDKILPRFNQTKQEAEDVIFVEAVKPIYEKLRATAFEKDGFCIVLPQRRSDLTTEGQSLNHCVGGDGYFRRHIAGTRLIFFVREVKNREKPFFTLEVNMETYHIAQLYGFGDCSAPADVRKFAEAFAKKLAPAKVARKAS